MRSLTSLLGPLIIHGEEGETGRFPEWSGSRSIMNIIIVLIQFQSYYLIYFEIPKAVHEISWFFKKGKVKKALRIVCGFYLKIFCNINIKHSKSVMLKCSNENGNNKCTYGYL